MIGKMSIKKYDHSSHFTNKNSNNQTKSTIITINMNTKVEIFSFI